MTVSVTIHVTEGGKPDFAYQVVCSDTALAAVLFDFNPSTNVEVTVLKALCAALIRQMEDVRANGTPAKARNAAVAITEIEGAQMRAVKALFAK